MLPQALTTFFQVAILVATSLVILTHSPLVEASFSPISFLISKSMSSGSKCCGGGAPRYPRMKASYSVVEAFDDGTPLSFYRQQVSQMYGGGGGEAGGYSSGGSGGGGYSGGMSSGGHGGGGGSHKPAMQLNQLYKNSFGYQSMLMGGGFMKKDHSGFGPAGTHTSKKWRGFGRSLLTKAKSGYGHGGDRLTNVHVVASGATDEYKDSYVTMIANTMKRGGGY